MKKKACDVRVGDRIVTKDGPATVYLKEVVDGEVNLLLRLPNNAPLTFECEEDDELPLVDEPTE